MAYLAMPRRSRRRMLGIIALVLATAMQPQPGGAQDFGDTPYVQTPQNVVDRMLQVANVGPADYVIDLGSGDGRMVITAAKKHGARGFGVDLDRRLVQLANRLAARAGVADRAVFYERDLYETDLSAASVVTIYLLPEVNLMVRPKLLATLKPGTRIVSHDYNMGDWPPDQQMVLDAPDKPVGRDKKSKVFFWVVPANVQGGWSLDAGGQKTELTLEQTFQKIHGTAALGVLQAGLRDARLRGFNIAFAYVDASGVRRDFTGRVNGGKMEGSFRDEKGAEGRIIRILDRSQGGAS